MNKRRILLAGIAAALLVALVGAVLLSSQLAMVALGVLQIIVVLLLLDTRHSLSARVYDAARKLERHLGSALRRSSEPKSSKPKSSKPKESEQSAAAPGPDPLDADVALVRASLVFDQEWYAAQTDGEFTSLDRAIRHYLTRGRHRGFTPHPLFSSQWMNPQFATLSVDPLLSYLRDEGDLRGRSTSPLFDPAMVDDKLEGCEFGLLTAFLRNRGGDWPLPYAPSEAFPHEGITLDELRAFLIERTRAWRAIEMQVAPTRGTGKPPAATEEFRAALEAFAARPAEDAPLVSVILPTWNRARLLRAAIDSIAGQSYANWELIVADDGSIDDTRLVLDAEAARDERIKPIYLPHRGVSATRNAALAAATGDYIAFLDSDKVWEPDFLRSMIAYLEVGGHEAGYSVVEVSVGGKTFYRAEPATRESLRVANSIDQTAIVARRGLIVRSGGFDETLPRAVDYDLILSISELADLVQVPYVGVRYSEDDQDPNRISEAQSVAWNYYVRDRRRWNADEVAPIEPGLVSVVVEGVGSPVEAHETIANIREHLGGVRAEILMLPVANSWSLVLGASYAEIASDGEARLLLMAGGPDRATLRVNAALRAARGEHVYVTTAQQRFDEGSVADLIRIMDEADAAVVHPIVIDHRRLVSDAGMVYAPGGRDPVGLLSGLPTGWAEWQTPWVAVPGAPLPLLLRGETVRELTGLNTRLKQLWVDVDASQRAAVAESKIVALSTGNVVQQRGATAFARAEETDADVRMFYALWPEAPAGSEEACRAAGVTPIYSGFTAISASSSPDRWTSATWRRGQWVDSVADREQAPLQWSIKTAAPADERAASWGDFHFANSLAAALRELGQGASVDYGPNAERPTANADDVVVNLRGLKDVQVPAGATSLIWVISHPDLVTANELRSYDLRYAASVSWPELVADQWGVDLKPMLQCTDPERFYIDDEAVPELVGKLVMVGNSRKQYRPAAWQTANAGMPVAIYGNNWEEFVDAKYIAGTYVPNEELRRYYRTADWALNDHWDDMREQGFISNRIFDVFASGGRLLTDDVAGLDGLFPADILPHGVATFSTPVDLLATAETGPAKYYSDESLRAISDHVRSEHSFLARARVMLEDVRAFRAAGRAN